MDARHKRVTVTDLARQAGVSRSTVSLVLQKSPLVKTQTRAQVERAIVDLGYVYNRAAANLRRRTSEVVAMVINDLANPFFGELAVGIESVLSTAGYVPLVANTGEDAARQGSVLSTMLEHETAGIIICPALGTKTEALELFTARRVPMVVVMRRVGEGTWDFVAPDNHMGTLRATEHLIGLGHRRICFLGGHEGTAVHGDRSGGFRKAMDGAGLAVEPGHVVEAELTRSGGVAALESVLATPRPPSAAICYSDVVAFGVMHGLTSRGYRPGPDFAVVGFDDVADAAHTTPPLTTVSVRPRTLGSVAARILLERIRDSSAPPVHHIATPQLAVRRSCGAGRANEDIA